MELDSTLYVSQEDKPRRNLSYPFLNENNFILLRTNKPDGEGLLQGPRRVARLCICGLMLPAILITIPLYVRLLLYPPGHYPMMPTDQRLLNHHVSTVWCQGQTTRMNGSYTAYLTPDVPTTLHERRSHAVIEHVNLHDDIKEYWGFHLLQGSTVTISACSSREGGQLLILRGVDNLHRCAWIGEEDSAEEDKVGGQEEKSLQDAVHSSLLPQSKERYMDKEEDDLHDQRNQESLERGGEPPVEGEGGEAAAGEKEAKPEEGVTVSNSSATASATEFVVEEDRSGERKEDLRQLLKEAIKMSKSKKEILQVLHSVGRKGKEPLPKGIRELMRRKTADRKVRSIDGDVSLKSAKGESEDHRMRSQAFDAGDEEEEDNGAFEEFDSTLESPHQGINLGKNKPKSELERMIGGQIFYPEGLKFERGKFNQTNKHDTSNEEKDSSYSSSEEALASCEGVILALPLLSYRGCTFRWMEMNKIAYDIPVTGTYYFVFSSDNEIDSNDLYFNLTIDRIVYNTQDSQEICSNTTDCLLPLSFFSKQQAIVEVPEEGTWENVYILETSCQPRVAIYLTFILLAPILILICALN